MPPQTAIVTGASSGIGRELAHLFAADGYNLVLVARQLEALNALVAEIARDRPVRARALAIDLSQTDAPRRIEGDLARASEVADVVVNNAGFGLQGAYADLPLDRQLAMIQVNVTALTDLTRRFLPGMLSRNRGGILNVGSTAGFQPGPFMAVYYATKAFVLSFSEALHSELSLRGVRVTVLCPGPVPTEFAARAGLKQGGRPPGMLSQSAERVAEAGFRGLMRGKRTVVPGIGNKLITLFIRVVPRRVLLRMVNSRQQRRRSAEGV